MGKHVLRRVAFRNGYRSGTNVAENDPLGKVLELRELTVVQCVFLLATLFLLNSLYPNEDVVVFVFFAES